MLTARYSSLAGPLGDTVLGPVVSLLVASLTHRRISLANGFLSNPYFLSMICAIRPMRDDGPEICRQLLILSRIRAPPLMAPTLLSGFSQSDIGRSLTILRGVKNLLFIDSLPAVHRVESDRSLDVSIHDGIATL